MKLPQSLAAILMAVAPLGAYAQKPADYPVKPVRVILGLAAGGGLDTMTRALSTKLSERWGQSVVVENRATAGGVVAVETVAKSEPDGYTWHASGSQLELTVVFHRINIDVLKALEPVVQMSAQPYVLVVAAKLPVHSVKDLIALAKAKPGQLNYGTAGPGSLAHIGHELMNMQAGVKMTHIPYKGGGAMIPDLLAGRVQLAFMPTLTATPLMKNGTARGIAVTSLQRVPSTPDVPTISEAGMPDFELSSAYGLFVPAKTPPAVVAVINRDVAVTLAQPDMQARLAADGATAPPAHTPAQYRALVERHIKRYGEVVGAAGITPDT